MNGLLPLSTRMIGGLVVVLIGGLAGVVSGTTSLSQGNGEGLTRGEPRSFDVVVVGGTPGGIMAAVAAARRGHTVVILERTKHIGGLPANGLGATDIATRGATGGLFLEFVDRVYRYYVKKYGQNSPQVNASSGGYHFEPSVAEKVFLQLLAEQSHITVLMMRQFDALSQNVRLEQ